MWHSFQTLLYFWHVVVVYLYTLAFSHLHEGSSPVLLRSGSHIVNQSGGRSQSQLRPGTVIKLGWAMWKRHRALNALTGDNMSTAQIDHMGSLCLLGMPAALRHCGELCHLVNGERETQRSVGKSMSGTTVCLFVAHQRQKERRGEHRVWNCMVLNKNAEEASMRRMK